MESIATLKPGRGCPNNTDPPKHTPTPPNHAVRRDFVLLDPQGRAKACQPSSSRVGRGSRRPASKQVPTGPPRSADCHERAGRTNQRDSHGAGRGSRAEGQFPRRYALKETDHTPQCDAVRANSRRQPQCGSVGWTFGPRQHCTSSQGKAVPPTTL